MKLKNNTKLFNILISSVTVIGLLLIWLIGAIVVDESIILPTPINAIGESFRLLWSGDFWLALLGTLGRAMIAFVVSFLIGVGLAIIVKFSHISRPIINIIISIIRAIPTIAVVLLLLLWTDSKIASMVVTMLVVLPMVYSMAEVALNRIDKDIIDMMKLYNISKKKILFKYIVPVISPEIMRMIGSVFSLNIKLIVASEVLAGTANSIGNLMQQSKMYFETPKLFALVIIMIIIAVIIEQIFNIISSKMRKRYGID